jgi:hypothetical protein
MKDPRLLRKQVLHTLATTMDAFVRNLQADKRYAKKLESVMPPKAAPDGK